MLGPGKIGRRLIIDRDLWELVGHVIGTIKHRGRQEYIRRAIREQLRRDGFTATDADAWSSPAAPAKDPHEKA